jgi:hypothetical protein
VGRSDSEPEVWGGAPVGASDSEPNAQPGELAALRRRAYGPDADIFADLEAVARLTELEDRGRHDRFPVTPDSAAETPAAQTRAAADSSPAVSDAAVIAVSPARAPRWHGALVAGTAAASVALAAVAWNAARETEVAETATFASASNDELDARYRENYREYVDGLRDDVLSLPGGEGVADRMIRDRLRPHGILYGRTVGVGPTVDHRFCMIIADLPEASVTCIPVENASANPVSVHLPAWYSDADSDLFTGLGDLVTYTLMPGGRVVAEPADSADAIALSDAPTPVPTAVPPPGWQ